MMAVELAQKWGPAMGSVLAGEKALVWAWERARALGRALAREWVHASGLASGAVSGAAWARA